MENYETLTADVVTIGGGAAGTRAAIEADDRGVDVILLSKGPVARSGLTPLAYPCLQAAVGAMDPRDNAGIHFNDITKEGKGLADENLAWALAAESVDRVQELQDMGIRFETEHGKLFQAHFPGQTYPRNLLLVGGGFGLISGLKRELRKRPRVKILEDFCVCDLLTEGSRVYGVVGVSFTDGRILVVEAKSVIMATGGYEALWANNDGSSDSTGDGISLAFEAGADVVDLEMIQYYPGVFAYPESLRGVDIQYETFLEKKYFDFKLVNNEGNEFLDGPLPGRDVLTRAVFKEIEEGRGTEHGAVYVDPTKSSKSFEEIDRLVGQFVQGPYRYWRKIGIDIRKDRIEICPAVHYTLGGIRINERAETSVPGLFAAGETSSNTHGANRIGGNSLAETQVFGARAGKYASEFARKAKSVKAATDQVRNVTEKTSMFFDKKKKGVRPIVLRKQLQRVMDKYVGANRNESGMTEALRVILDLKQNVRQRVQVQRGGVFNTDWRTAIELVREVELAEMVVRSAMLRKESRGNHFRSDFPIAREPARHTLIRKNGHELTVSYTPVNKRDA